MPPETGSALCVLSFCCLRSLEIFAAALICSTANGRLGFWRRAGSGDEEFLRVVLGILQ
jgi:hypothetical protein